MASEHESNSYDDSDNMYYRNNLEDSSSLTEKKLTDIPGSKSESQTLLHQHHGNELTSSQNLPSSSNQQLGTESSSFQDNHPQSIHQPQGISNTLESSNPQYHQTYENNMSRFQYMAIVPPPEITSSVVDRGYLPPNNLSETEFRRSQNILPLCEEQLSDTDDSHPLAIQVSQAFPSVNSVTHQQSWREKWRPQGSYAVLHKIHASSSNVNPTVREYSLFPDGSGKEFRHYPDTNPGYFQYWDGTSEIQGSPMEILQQSESRENYLQSLHTQGLQQSESDPNFMILSSGIKSTLPGQYSIMGRYLKQPIVNQDAFRLSQQPAERRTREIQGFHQVPEKFKINNPTERNFSHSPYSPAQQQSMKRSRVVQPVIRRPIGTRHLDPLFNRFLEMCIASDRNRSFYQNFSRADHYDLGMLQHPYAKKSESMNILVCGPLNWTSRLIKTFARGLQVRYESPFKLVWQLIVTRCGIITSVSVWQVGNLTNSIHFLKSSCVSSKTTIMCVFNLTEEILQPMIQFIRCQVNLSVPVVFVACKPSSISIKAFTKLTNAGFQLKAKSDLKAFLLCLVDSVEEVDSVFFTAIDASLLHTI